jgi:hypothetical protein
MTVIINKTKMKVRLFSFNCLTSAHLKEYEDLPTEVLNQDRRHTQILDIIQSEMEEGSIIALQEVELSLKSKLFCLSLEHDYIMRDVHNGSERDNYIGPALLWPNSYDLEKFEQVRVGDKIKSEYGSLYTAKEQSWTSWIYDKTCNRKISQKRQKDISAFNYACSKWNWLLLVELRDKEENKRFIVATYHAPCAYWEPLMQHYHTVAIPNIIERFKGTSKTPTFIIGDLNITPDLLSKYAKYSNSAHKIQYGKEREWTCWTKIYSPYKKIVQEFKGTLDYIILDKDDYAIENFEYETKGMIPSKDYPSDHKWIAAVIGW